MADEVEELKRRLQDQASINQRIQFELETHVREIQPLIQNFNKYVTDPIDGGVVKLRHLENSVRHLDIATADAIRKIGSFDAHESRITELENINKDRKETRRWVTRDVLIVGAMLVVSSLITAWLTIKLLGK